MGVGMGVSGVVIRRLKLGPRQVAAWIGATACAYATSSQQGGVVFSSCACLEEGASAMPGQCQRECSSFPWYLVVFSLFIFIHSTSEVGGMLLTLRCVHPKDK